MKRTLLLSASVLTTLLGSPALASDPAANSLVMISSRQVFVPNGFDDNDESLAVLDGYLPDSCHKLAYNEAKFDPATNTFSVTQWARKFSGFPCVEVMVPFFTEVDLGVLPAGNFTVKTNGASEALTVKEATNAGPDDFIYAPIDQARVERDEGNKYVAVLDGRYTNSCMQMAEVKVIDSGKSLEVLPVLAMTNGADCHAAEVPFSWRVELPAGISQGRHLLHVRSLNGKSVNNVFSVYPASVVTR